MEADLCLKLVGVLQDLDEMWGFARLGLILSAASLLGVTQSASDIAGQLKMSDDTVRRLIKPLVNIGRVTVVREGRKISYHASPVWAQRTRERVAAAFVLAS